ncbi:MAG TPA: hypothetical protein VLE53_02640 [Gemmatimonadaceae bacterium]|nr:hypothetical protein [Gemmatimonadaceae bacterium]
MKCASFAVAGLLAVCACYRYIPETAPEPLPGSEYRAHLTPEGAALLRPLLGQDVIRVDGRVLAVSDTAYQVAMGATGVSTDPRPVIWSGEQMWIPRAAVERFERRELDRPRTMRAAALYTAGVMLAGSVWLSINGRASERGGGGPGPTPPP